MEFSFDKFANAVLFVLSKCDPPPGLTALVKLLFRADFEHYRQHLRPITGVEYLALSRGPVPHEYQRLFRELVARGDVELELVNTAPGMRPMESYKPLRAPERAAFSASEIDVLTQTVESHGHKSGVALSQEAHDDLPWRCVWRDGEGDGSVIPYMLARWEENRCTADDIAAAAESLKRPEVQAALTKLSVG